MRIRTIFLAALLLTTGSTGAQDAPSAERRRAGAADLDAWSREAFGEAGTSMEYREGRLYEPPKDEPEIEEEDDDTESFGEGVGIAVDALDTFLEDTGFIPLALGFADVLDH